MDAAQEIATTARMRRRCLTLTNCIYNYELRTTCTVQVAIARRCVRLRALCHRSRAWLCNMLYVSCYGVRFASAKLM
eukprot:6209240-Pleurochrysis_carterae.AAC.3